MFCKQNFSEDEWLFIIQNVYKLRNFNQLVVKETYTSETINVASNGSVTIKIPISKTGYKPVGIGGYSVVGNHNEYVNMYSCMLNNSNEVSAVFKNNYTSSQDLAIKACVLYVKNT